MQDARRWIIVAGIVAAGPMGVALMLFMNSSVQPE
jgi:hypothetical protein